MRKSEKDRERKKRQKEREREREKERRKKMYHINSTPGLFIYPIIFRIISMLLNIVPDSSNILVINPWKCLGKVSKNAAKISVWNKNQRCLGCFQM